MQTLYELAQAYNNILDLVLDETMPLDDIENALEHVEGDIEVKVKNGIGLIKSLEALRDARKAEGKRLTDGARFIDGRIKAIKQGYVYGLDAIGKKKVSTERGTMTVKDNPPSLVIDDESKIPAGYMTLIPEHYEVNKEAIKTALKAGETVEGAHLEKGRGLMIR